MGQIVVFTVPMGDYPSTNFGPSEGKRWKLIHATIVLKTGTGAGTRQLQLYQSNSLEKGSFGSNNLLNTGAVNGVSSLYTVALSPQGGITGVGRTLVQVNPYPEYGHMDTLTLQPNLISGDTWAAFLEAVEEEDGD